jgi:membrane-associated phospholipid phosphatase
MMRVCPASDPPTLTSTVLSRPADSWPRAVVRRLLALWPVKLVGISAGISLFFVLYFWAARSPQAAVTVMPVLALDRWFTLREGLLPVYASLWVYVSLAPAFSRDRGELLRYTLRAAVMSAIGFAFYLFYPSAVPDFGVDWSQYGSLQFLRAGDASRNAFPSLHVSFAVLTCHLLARQLRELDVPVVLRWANLAWCVGIAYSTIAIRQHVVVDVLGGLVLGVLVAALPLRGPAR